MLNDASRLARASAFFQTLAGGLMLGSLFVLGRDPGTGLVLAGIGLVAMLTWAIGFSVLRRRLDARLREDVARGSADIVTDPAKARLVPGRVVRRRIAARSSGFVLGQPGAASSSAVVLVVKVLDGATSRRTAALVPALLGLQVRRDHPVSVALHPTDPRVAVLDDAVSVADLAALDTDPRWRTTPQPTNASVTGGYLAIAGVALAGLLTGLGLDALVTLLAT